MGFWNRQSPVKIALSFVEACNARDSAKLARLLHDNFVFQDSRGGILTGRRAMLDALVQVQSVAPDLRLEIESAVPRGGDSVLLSGRSITANPTLAVDTQWRAVVEGEKLVEWQAFGKPASSSVVGLLQALTPSD